jgi:hypothetical protein
VSALARPKLAGSYVDWEAENVLTLPAAIGGIVAIAQTAAWGPIRTPTLLGSFDAFTRAFGPTDCPLRRAVYGAFKGEGRPGHGGAGSVLAYRMGVSGTSAPATKTINNTTPAVAITFTALYHGTRGNDFRFTTQAGTVGGTTDLIILDGSRPVEKYTFTSTDIAGLAAQLNASSDWFSAVANVTGVALATISAVAATGGNDGDTLTATEWTQARDAFDGQRWSLIVTPGMTDSSIRASFVAWIQQRRDLGKRAMLVLGGAAAETVSTANTRSTAINDYDVVNVGGPTLHLDDLGVDASSSDMAARVAGAIANRGERRDLIYARFADVSVPAGVSLPTLTDEASALDAGTTVFTQDTNTGAPIFIREGVTTYANDSLSPVDGEGVKTHPVALYKRIKNLRIQHAVELELNDWATTGDVLGELPVDDRTRAIVIGTVQSFYQRREDAEIVQPGWTVILDPEVEVSDDDDFVALLHGFKPTRSSRQFFHRIRIG